MNQDELKKRTKQFAIRIIKLTETLPNTATGNNIRNQLIRCGTSVGANYRAVCRGKSRADFIAKLGIVLEETDESAFWLELIIECKLLRKDLLEPLLTEANELTAIFDSSIISAKKHLKSEIKNLK